MKKLRIAIIGLACAALSLSAFAEDTDGFENEVHGTLGLTDGNSETLNANAGASTKKIAGDNEFTAGIDYNYGESTVVQADGTSVDEKNTDNIQADAQYNRLLSERNYAYLRGTYLSDDIAEIDYRVIAGPGLGRYLMKDEDVTLAVEVGAAYLTEDVADISDDAAILRVAQRYERKLGEGAKVWESVEYLPEFEDFDNYLLNAELGAEAMLTGTVSLRVTVQDRYDSTPAVGTDENDLSVNAGVGIKI